MAHESFTKDNIVSLTSLTSRSQCGVQALLGRFLYYKTSAMNRTYGYNLYVASNTTAAVLDTPFPTFTQPLQAGLRLGDSLQISTTVNATVSENIDLTPSQQGDPAFWGTFSDGTWTYNDIDMNFDFNSGFLVRTNCTAEEQIL